MIQYNPKTWFSLIFKIPKSDTLKILLPELVIMTIYTAGLTLIEVNYKDDLTIFKNTITVHSLIGFVIGLLLVFRTNTAYDRWWEGRKQWGAVVNNTRNLSILIQSIVPKERKDDLEYLQKMIANFPFALKNHLRNEANEEEYEMKESDLNALKEVKHHPNFIVKQIQNRLHILNKKGVISNQDKISCNELCKGLIDNLGACERIKNTPIPYSYSLFIKKFIFIYVITLPIGFIPSFEYWTIPIALFVFYILVSLEILAEEIEDPFGKDDNDLDTDGISLRIRENVTEIFKTK